ncbi:hypothetical protein PIB30_104433 [Stylosanthes scabra]|uniref:Uncharacterized protein n=1 Tax=Stylosanthes scabra TaxID=79078 RepID=A0ABU6RYS2_9FABA|nr:hypothetical protein [Stylosanthes scabra]
MQGSRRDKPTIEFDPEIVKTLKKNRSRVKAQRTLQFDQEEGNSEEGVEAGSKLKELFNSIKKKEIPRKTFYDGTLPTSRILLDSAANGSIRTKTPDEALELIEL